MVNPFEETLQAGKVSDDYNIGRFGEFDRFEDERAFMPEAFERPQSTIGGYDELGYTLPASEPDHWFWGYSRPGDVVEQERGIYPLIQRHAPDWMKNIYRGAKGAWGGITDDTITGPGFIDNILEWTNDYISPSQQIAQSKWRGEKALSDAIQLEMNTLDTGDAFEALRSLETKRGGSYPPAAIEIAINLMKGVG